MYCAYHARRGVQGNVPSKASWPLIQILFNMRADVSIIFTHQLVSFLASSFSAINVNLINQAINQATYRIKFDYIYIIEK